MSDNILVSQNLRELYSDSCIRATKPIEEKNIQPNSLDLRLDEDAFELPYSFLPRKNESIYDVIKNHRKIKLDQEPLKKGKIYVIKLLESLSLFNGLRASANPKSSTGRIDVFSRLLVDNHSGFDDTPLNYEGDLYLKVLPQSFNIQFVPGISLNQLGLFEGNPRLTDQEIHKRLRRDSLVFKEDNIYSDIRIDSGLHLSVDIDSGLAAYRAKNTEQVLDLSNPNNNKTKDFWDEIYSDKSSIILEREKFYILSTKEKVRIPHDLCAFLKPMDERLGDVRAHYAGWFDTGFGYGEKGEIKGTPVTLEVRSLETDFRLTQAQSLAVMIYTKNKEKPDKIYGLGNNYQNQKGITPGKYFTD